MANFLNPVIVLAASASRAGNSMFTNELLATSRGLRDCKAIRRRFTRLAGFHPMTVALCVEDSILLTGNASLKRPHILDN